MTNALQSAAAEGSAVSDRMAIERVCIVLREAASTDPDPNMSKEKRGGTGFRSGTSEARQLCEGLGIGGAPWFGSLLPDLDARLEQLEAVLESLRDARDAVAAAAKFDETPSVSRDAVRVRAAAVASIDAAASGLAAIKPLVFKPKSLPVRWAPALARAEAMLADARTKSPPIRDVRRVCVVAADSVGVEPSRLFAAAMTAARSGFRMSTGRFYAESCVGFIFCAYRLNQSEVVLRIGVPEPDSVSAQKPSIFSVPDWRRSLGSVHGQPNFKSWVTASDAFVLTMSMLDAQDDGGEVQE